MPLIRKREIRQMPVEERRKKIDELNNELVKLRTRVASGGTIENPGRIKEIRRTIAKIMTIDREAASEGSPA